MTTVADVLAGVARNAEQEPTHNLAHELGVALHGQRGADSMVALAAAIAKLSLDSPHPDLIAEAIHKMAVDEIARCKAWANKRPVH